MSKKSYTKPEIELIVFRYTDVMAASGEEPSVEIGVGDEEGGSFGLSSDEPVWDGQ